MARRNRADPPGTDAAVAEIAAAFEQGELDRALARAEELVRRAPLQVDALHYRAAALHQLGREDEAALAYQQALSAAPDDPELMLGAADLLITRAEPSREALEDGLRLCARARKLAARAGAGSDDGLAFELLLLEAVGLNQLGDAEGALSRVGSALALQPQSADAKLERALALFELCRFDEALAALQELAAQTPDDAWVHHQMGLIHERRKQPKEARRCFARARELAPADFPAPVQLSEAEFDRAVEAAVRALPEHVKAYLENTVLAVQPLPTDEDLLAERPPLSPTILGIFHGTPVGQRAGNELPARIILYQRNLERFARTREELIEQIGITVMHEVGHLIGLEEEDLWERGLD